VTQILHHLYLIITWLTDLFNAPPRLEMNYRQKIGRILLVTGTMVVVSILTAMAAALGIFVFERIFRAIKNIPNLWDTTWIITVGILVNALCVYVLFLVRRLDRKLMLGPGETPSRP
jgi:uncharacterized membrane protein YidH (DUF202 family)